MTDVSLSIHTLQKMRQEQKEAYRYADIIREYTEKLKKIEEKAKDRSSVFKMLPSQIDYKNN